MSDTRSERFSADFWLYFTGQSISALGSAFTAFAMPLLVFKLTGSALDLGVSMAISIMPYLLFGFVAGAIVDRVDRRKLMVGIDLVRGVLLIVLPVLQAFGALHLIWIYVVAFVGTTLQIPFDAGRFAGTAHLVLKDQLTTANGRLEASFSAARVVGPVLAGVAVMAMPVADLLIIDAVTFVASAVLLSLIRVSFNGDRPADDTPASVGDTLRALRADVYEGLAYIWRDPVLRSISIVMAVVNLFTSTTLAQLVLYAKSRLSASDDQVSLLYAASALGVMLLSLAAGPLRRRFRLGVILVATLALDGMTVIGLGMTSMYSVALVLWALNSGVSVLFNINTMTLRQQTVPDRMLGRVMTVSAVVAWSVIPIGVIAGGALVSRLGGIAPVFVMIGVVTVLAAVIGAFSPLGSAQAPAVDATASVKPSRVDAPVAIAETALAPAGPVQDRPTPSPAPGVGRPANATREVDA